MTFRDPISGITATANSSEGVSFLKTMVAYFDEYREFRRLNGLVVKLRERTDDSMDKDVALTLEAENLRLREALERICHGAGEFFTREGIVKLATTALGKDGES